MGKRFLEITPELQSFIEEQSLFFVGSAPLSANGHVNVSPKGLDTFRVGNVEFVQTSCGYAVPEMKLVSQRKTLTRWAEVKGDEGLVEYRRTHNRVSLDALETPVTDASE